MLRARNVKAMTAEDVERIYKQIANLALVPIPVKDIARILDATEESVQKIMAMAEYKEVERQIQSDKLEENQSFNQSWDSLEKRSLQIIDANLKFNKDAEFALRVAVVTNRARRRGINNDAVIPGNQNMRASISLPITFVTNLQNNGGQVAVDQTVQVGEAKQRVNCLMPAQVEQLFKPKAEIPRDQDMLDGVAIRT